MSLAVLIARILMPMPVRSVIWPWGII
jgi:hypothetical protein